MPYIKKDLREEIEPELGALVQKLRSMEEFNSNNGRAGVLNYVITYLIDSCYGPLSDAKYKDYNEAIGMLECCKLEFYRKAAAPYEDLKERENGSVLDIKRYENIEIKDFSRQTSVSKNTMPQEKKFIEYPFELRPELSINDITGEDVKKIFNGFVKHTNIEIMASYKLWIVFQNKLIEPGLSTFCILDIDNKTGLIKKGSNRVMDFGADIYVYSEIESPINITKETINRLDLNSCHLLTKEDIKYLYNNKISVEVFCQDIQKGIKKLII